MRSRAAVTQTNAHVERQHCRLICSTTTLVLTVGGDDPCIHCLVTIALVALPGEPNMRACLGHSWGKHSATALPGLGALWSSLVSTVCE